MVEFLKEKSHPSQLISTIKAQGWLILCVGDVIFDFLVHLELSLHAPLTFGTFKQLQHGTKIHLRFNHEPYSPRFPNLNIRKCIEVYVI